ncbi:MAG: ABC transporter substrate-binding protein [Clostridiales bacterium]|nr:ABC transporter substrate-binding protein [Clostridiales bacterium]
MKNQRFKTLAVILSVMLLAIQLFSCSDKTESPAILSDTTASVASDAEGETTTEPEETAPDYDPKIAPYDSGGHIFNILYNGNDFEPNLDFAAVELNGEALNDAIFMRNSKLNEKYNMEIKATFKDDGTIVSSVSKAVKAGTPDFDMVEVNGNFSMNLAIAGVSCDLDNIPYIDFEKPYWNSFMLDGSSIGGKNYFVYGDMNIHALGATPCTLFNKVVHANYGFEDLYTIVREGRWTFDSMGEMIKAVTSDLDGDGKITQLDTLGFIGNTFVIDCFLSGTGYQTIPKDENDLPYLAIDNPEYINVVDSIVTLCKYDNGTYICDRYAGVDREYAPMDALAADRALFWIANLKGVERMRNMISDFGIVPIPKLNEIQQDYKIHYQANIGAAISIPLVVADQDLVGMVLEDCAYMSDQTVQPAYIETLLKGKFLRDDASEETMRIMLSSYYADLGFMLNGQGIDILTQLRTLVSKESTDVASKIAKLNTSYQKKLDKVIATYENAE